MNRSAPEPEEAGEPSELAREVWDLLVTGYDLDEIAAALGVSIEEVQSLAGQAGSRKRLDRDTMKVLAGERLRLLLPPLMQAVRRGNRRASAYVAEISRLQAVLGEQTQAERKLSDLLKKA